MDAILEFNVSNQIITRVDNFDVVGDSLNYLYAHFNFLTDEWTGTPTAIFHNDGKAYNAILDHTNTCLVPHEVLETDDRYVLVSVFCGDRVTANKAKVFVAESGWTDDMEASEPPTPSVYAQIIDRMDGIESAVQDATERTETAAEKAEAAASHYPRIINEYWYVWDVEEEDFVNTNIKAEAVDGTSATVEVLPSPDGHTVIITDSSGEHVFDVPDGYDGNGIASIAKTGSSGDVDTYTMTFTKSEPFVYYVTNGVSATITSTPITDGHRLTITDKNGTRTVDVMNGAKGDTGVGIYSIVKSAEYQNVDYYTITYTNGNKTTFSVTNGFSPIVTVTERTGGHTITITDVNGTQSFDVLDGNAGGLPIHICSSSEYDHSTGIPTIQNPDSATFYLVPANNGSSPDMFVEWIYVNSAWEMFGSASIDLSDYATKTELNGKVDKVTGKGLSTNDYTTAEKNKLSGIASGAEVNVQSDWNQTNTSADDYIKNKPTIPSAITVDDELDDQSTNPVQNKVVKGAVDGVIDDLRDLETAVNGKVGDVQVNGTSVVSQGVANIPKASNGVLGVSRPNSMGVNVNANGDVYITGASTGEIKSAENQYKPIVPPRQHDAVFYGLAKAASDTTQSASSNAVGNYTDAAKVAIQKMLGIYEPPWELLNDITLDSEREIDLTADSNGTPYNLLGVYIYVYYVANLTTATSGYARYRCYDSKSRYCNAETGKYATSTNAKFKHIFLDRRNNLAFLNYTTQQTIGGAGSWTIKSGGNTTLEESYNGALIGLDNIVRIATPSGDVEPEGTRILIYGQRAY